MDVIERVFMAKEEFYRSTLIEPTEVFLPPEDYEALERLIPGVQFFRIFGMDAYAFDGIQEITCEAGLSAVMTQASFASSGAEARHG